MSLIRSVSPTLRVSSVDEALPFYEALGFSVAWRHQLEPGAPRMLCLTQDSKEILLTEHPVAPFGAVVHLMVTELETIVSRARGARLEPTFGPEQRPWGDREAHFTDPDGNVLRFGETVE